MFHDHLDCSQKLPLGGRSNTKPVGDHDTLNAHNRWFILIPSCVRIPHELKSIEIAFSWGPGHRWLHTTLEDLWPCYMILEVCWDGLWTLSYGLSQFHGRGSWLVCEEALSLTTPSEGRTSRLCIGGPTVRCFLYFEFLFNKTRAPSALSFTPFRGI